MSRTQRDFKVSVIVDDNDRLPDGVDDDTVVADLIAVVEEAVVRWHADRGHRWADEPLVL